MANHPFGGIEGIILAALLRYIRPDVKIMANYFLRQIPELQEVMIFVDPFGKDSSTRKNIRPLKECLGHLRAGGVLGVFPAGEVSHVYLSKRRVLDPPWTPTVARLIHKTQAPVLPIFFRGHNGPLFQMLGLVHPRLRTVMLPRELVNKSRKTITVSAGSLIGYSKMEAMQEDQELMDYLRLRTYILRNRPLETINRRRFLRLPKKKVHKALHLHMEEVAQGPSLEDLSREVHSLPREFLLSDTAEYEVYGAPSSAIPLALQEIGRLREITFRKVGEGTGKAADLDRFDEYYDHIFIWNKNHQGIAGAYRIGRTDKILAEKGIDGLYTSTLFNYKPELFKRMGRALELGRSFVRPEYQKHYAPLLLLWKGITQSILRHWEYTALFGPVSISNEYSSTSRELIVRALKSTESFSDLTKLVKPKTPPKLKSLRRYEVRQLRDIFQNLGDITSLITDIEPIHKGIPVLLKQYLKLGGKVLAFNVDPEFNNALDGLLLVDLTRTDKKILDHYLGREKADAFLAHHLGREGRQD